MLDRGSVAKLIVRLTGVQRERTSSTGKSSCSAVTTLESPVSSSRVNIHIAYGMPLVVIGDREREKRLEEEDMEVDELS